MSRVLVAALVLAFAGTTLAAGQATGGPDLAVVSVTAPDPDRFPGQATQATVEVVVRNQGNVDVPGYQIHYFWGSSPMNGDQQSSVDVHDDVLRAGKDQRHQWQWHVQDGQVGPGTIRVVVQVAGDGVNGAGDMDPADNEGADSAYVKLHNALVSPPQTARSIHFGEEIFVRFPLHNQGNVPETFFLSAPTATGSGSRLATQWAQQTFVLGPGARGNATLYVLLPDTGDAAPVGALLDVVFQTASGIRLTATTPQISSVETPYPDDYRSALAAPEKTGFASTAQPATLAWTVRNVGRADDTYRLVLPDQQGWDFDLAETHLALEPGEQVRVQATATPAGFLAPGTLAQAVLQVRSTHPAPPQSSPAPVRVAGPAPAILGVQLPPALYRGEEAQATLLLRNDGNAAIPGSVLGLTVDGNGFDRAIQADVASILPEEASEVHVPLGSMDKPGSLVLQASWHPPGSSAVVHGLETVVRSPWFAVIPPPAADAAPGESVAYTKPPHLFRVKNLGNETETVRVRVVAEGGQASLATSDAVTVPPQQERGVPVLHTIPFGTDRHTSSVHFEVAVQDHPRFAWNASVATRIVDKVNPAISVAVRPLEWQVRDPLPVDVLVEDDGRIGAAYLSVAPPAGAERTYPLYLASGHASTEVTFPAAGDYRLLVSASDAAGNRGVLAWTVRAQADPVPVLTPEQPLSQPLDANTPFVLLVQHASVPQIHYALTQNGSVRASGNVPILEGRATIPLHDATAGDATLAVSIDRAGAGPATTEYALRIAPGAVAPSTPTAPPTTTSMEAPGQGAAVLLAVLACALTIKRRDRRE